METVPLRQKLTSYKWIILSNKYITFETFYHGIEIGEQDSQQQNIFLIISLYSYEQFHEKSSCEVC